MRISAVIVGVGIPIRRSIVCTSTVARTCALQDERVREWRRRRWGRINENRKREQEDNERKDGEDAARTVRGATHRWRFSKECGEQRGSGWFLSSSSSSSEMMGTGLSAGRQGGCNALCFRKLVATQSFGGIGEKPNRRKRSGEVSSQLTCFDPFALSTGMKPSNRSVLKLT